MTSRTILLASFVPAIVAACGSSTGPGAGFDIHYADNRPADVGAVAGAIAAHPESSGAPIVALVPPPPERGLAVYSLANGQRIWQNAARLDARPVAVGDVILSHTEGQVVAWNLSNGSEAWRTTDHGYSLVGAGGDQDLVALSLGPGGLNQRHGVFLVLDARTGSERMEQVVEQALGTPTAAAGYAVVPWNGQYLSIFDIGRGREAARIRSTDDVFSRAFRVDNAVYFGARDVYRLSAEAGAGHRSGAPMLALPREDLPGNPPLMNDGYTPAYAGINARERVTVILRPDPAANGMQLTDGQMYELFHRVVFAIDEHAPGTVHWAHLADADVAGCEPVRGGIVCLDEHGLVTLLDAHTGNVVFQQALAAPAAQAVVRVPIDFAPAHNASEAPANITTGFLTVAASTDDRLLPARIFAARALAALPGNEATLGLLDIASRRAYPQELRAAAGAALAERHEGIDALVQALDTHYDYLRGTDGPPVGYIARALVSAHDTRGIPGLIAQLSNPDTAATELPSLVSALKDFGDPSAVPALLDFVRLYHSDEGAVPPVGTGEPVNERSSEDQQALSAAMVTAVQAIAQLGTSSDRQWLQAMADDPNAVPELHRALQALLASAAPAAGDTGGTASADTSNTAAPIDPNLPPPRLTYEMISNAFDASHDAMMACLNGLPSRPTQVRLQFRYDSDGNISTLTVIPTSLQACIAPIASRVHLPHSQVSREIGTYYLLGGPP